MPITVKSAKGTLNTMGLTWDLNLQPLDATEHLSAGTLNGKVVGDSPTGFAAFYMKTVQSLFVTVTMGGTPITALTLKITGYNQFNELVSENLAYVATGGQQTTKCYRRVTGCSIVAITGTPAAGDTVSLGYSLVTPRVPFLAKVPAGAVLSVYDAGQTSTQPTFTAQDVVSGDERYSIVSASVSPLVPTNGLGTIHVTVDPGAAGL
jgi:hypothetical protein